MTDIVIKATKAPNLPIPTIGYSQTYQESFSNALRLYFNTLDAFTSNLSLTDGGSSLSFPHIAASDTTDQYATGNNIPTLIAWNTGESVLGFTLLSGAAIAAPDNNVNPNTDSPVFQAIKVGILLPVAYWSVVSDAAI